MRKRRDLWIKVAVGMVGLVLGLCVQCSGHAVCILSHYLLPSSPGTPVDGEPTERPLVVVDATATSVPPTSTPAGARSTPAPTREFPSTDPDDARDRVVVYVVEHHPELADSLADAAWEALPEPSVHAFAVYNFESDRWRLDMTVIPANVASVDGEPLEDDLFDVELWSCSPPPYVLWRGRYAPDIDVEERLFVSRERSPREGAISSEAARDLAFAAMEAAHGVTAPPRRKWRETVVVDWVWASEVVYEAKGWGLWEVWVRWDEMDGLYHVEGVGKTGGFRTGFVTTHTEWIVRVSADGQTVEELHFESYGMP